MVEIVVKESEELEFAAWCAFVNADLVKWFNLCCQRLIAQVVFNKLNARMHRQRLEALVFRCRCLLGCTVKVHICDRCHLATEFVVWLSRQAELPHYKRHGTSNREDLRWLVKYLILTSFVVEFQRLAPAAAYCHCELNEVSNCVSCRLKVVDASNSGREQHIVVRTKFQVPEEQLLTRKRRLKDRDNMEKIREWVENTFRACLEDCRLLRRKGVLYSLKRSNELQNFRARDFRPLEEDLGEVIPFNKKDNTLARLEKWLQRWNVDKEPYTSAWIIAIEINGQLYVLRIQLRHVHPFYPATESRAVQRQSMGPTSEFPYTGVYLGTLEPDTCEIKNDPDSTNYDESFSVEQVLAGRLKYQEYCARANIQPDDYRHPSQMQAHFIAQVQLKYYPPVMQIVEHIEGPDVEHIEGPDV
jgi:hypothetical protein